MFRNLFIGVWLLTGLIQTLPAFNPGDAVCVDAGSDDFDGTYIYQNADTLALTTNLNYQIGYGVCAPDDLMITDGIGNSYIALGNPQTNTVAHLINVTWSAISVNLPMTITSGACGSGTVAAPIPPFAYVLLALLFAGASILRLRK